MNSILSTLFYSILFLVVFMFATLVGAAVTGRDRRAYSVLQPDEMIELAGQKLSVEELVKYYQPKMHLRKSNPSPPLLWTWYEAIPNGQSIDLVFYHVWENEINPNPAIHKFYALFRSAYFGYPLYDIEYFQVTINLANEGIAGLLFETSPGDDYFVTISQHVVARYAYQDRTNSFNVTYTTRAGEFISNAENQPVLFDQARPLVLAQTWNHLSRLLLESDADVEYLDAQPKPLSDKEYSDYKFVRKSQGDHKTQENRLSSFLGLLATSVFVKVPSRLLLSLQRKNKPGEYRS